MIIHESIKIFDKSSMSLYFFSYQSWINMFFSAILFLIHRLDVFSYFHNQKHLCQWNSFFRFVNVSNFYWKFYVFKIMFLAKSLSALYVWHNCSKYWLKHIIDVTSIYNYFCFWAWIKIFRFCFILVFCLFKQKPMLPRIWILVI